MTKTLGAIVGICIIAISVILIPVVAQDNSGSLQGDDVEIFTVEGVNASLQGDDVEIFSPQLEPAVPATSPQTEAEIEPDVSVDLATLLPTANPNALIQLSDTVDGGLPEINRNTWQTTFVDNTFLMIGGGLGGVLLLVAAILILSGMRAEPE